jgi:hypothetical protein
VLGPGEAAWFGSWEFRRGNARREIAVLWLSQIIELDYSKKFCAMAFNRVCQFEWKLRCLTMTITRVSSYWLSSAEQPESPIADMNE